MTDDTLPDSVVQEDNNAVESLRYGYVHGLFAKLTFGRHILICKAEALPLERAGREHRFGSLSKHFTPLICIVGAVKHSLRVMIFTYVGRARDRPVQLRCGPPSPSRPEHKERAALATMKLGEMTALPLHPSRESKVD